MMLWPHAWPMPGRASYSSSTAMVGPASPARAAKAVSTPKAPRSTVEALLLEHAGEEVVGEVLLVVRLGVLVDLVGQLERAGRLATRPRRAGAP